MVDYTLDSRPEFVKTNETFTDITPPITPAERVKDVFSIVDPGNETTQPSNLEKVFSYVSSRKLDPEIAGPMASQGMVWGLANNIFQSMTNSINKLYEASVTQDVTKASEHAFDITSTLAGVGTSFAQKGAAGIFGGKLTADVGSRSRRLEAESLTRLGYDPEAILKRTGWFKDVDLMWKLRISDEKAKLTQLGQDLTNNADTAHTFTDQSKLKLSEFLEHPELYKHYPDLKNAEIVIKSDLVEKYNARAFFDEANMKIYLSPQALRDPKVLPHEVQHWIQKREGFARGGQPYVYHTEFYNENKAVIDEMEKLNDKSIVSRGWEGTARDFNELTPKERQFFNDNYDAYTKFLELRNETSRATESYLKLHGEAEARRAADEFIGKASRKGIPKYDDTQVFFNSQVMGEAGPVSPWKVEDAVQRAMGGQKLFPKGSQEQAAGSAPVIRENSKVSLKTAQPELEYRGWKKVDEELSNGAKFEVYTHPSIPDKSIMVTTKDKDIHIGINDITDKWEGSKNLIDAHVSGKTLNELDSTGKVKQLRTFLNELESSRTEGKAFSIAEDKPKVIRGNHYVNRETIDVELFSRGWKEVENVADGLYRVFKHPDHPNYNVEVAQTSNTGRVVAKIMVAEEHGAFLDMLGYSNSKNKIKDFRRLLNKAEGKKNEEWAKRREEMRKAGSSGLYDKDK